MWSRVRIRALPAIKFRATGRPKLAVGAVARPGQVQLRSTRWATRLTPAVGPGPISVRKLHTGPQYPIDVEAEKQLRRQKWRKRLIRIALFVLVSALISRLPIFRDDDDEDYDEEDDDEDFNFFHYSLLAIQEDWNPKDQATAALLQKAVDSAEQENYKETLRALMQLWRASGRVQGDRLVAFPAPLLLLTVVLFSETGDEAGSINFGEEAVLALDHASLHHEVAGDAIQASDLTFMAISVRATIASSCMSHEDIPRDVRRAERIMRPAAKQVIEMVEEIRKHGAVNVESLKELEYYCDVMQDVEKELGNVKERLRFTRYSLLISPADDDPDLTCNNILEVSSALGLLIEKGAKDNPAAIDSLASSIASKSTKPVFADVDAVLRTLSLEELCAGTIEELTVAVDACLKAARPLILKVEDEHNQSFLFRSLQHQISEYHIMMGDWDRAIEALILVEKRARRDGDERRERDAQERIERLRGFKKRGMPGFVPLSS